MSWGSDAQMPLKSCQAGAHPNARPHCWAPRLCPVPCRYHHVPCSCLAALQNLPAVPSQPSGDRDSAHLAPCPPHPFCLQHIPHPSHLPHAARPTSRRFGGGSALLCPPRPWYLPLQLLPSPCSVPVTQLHRGPSARLVQICSQPPLSSHQSDPGHKQQRETTEPGSHTPSPWALAA